MTDIETYDALVLACSARHMLANTPTPEAIDAWRADMRLLNERFFASLRTAERERIARMLDTRAAYFHKRGYWETSMELEGIAVELRAGEP
jgi:hypothetical protein